MGYKYIKNNIKSVIKFLFQLVIVVLSGVLIKNYVLIPAIINGDSMYPTFSNGDRVLVNKITYKFFEPTYNDIVFFPFRGNNSHIYVKRIIGKPGDVIDFKENSFFVNGNIVDDDFSKEIIVSMGNVEYPVTLEEKSYFVLGDNRNQSKDSRYKEVGNITKDEIIGKLMFKYWPIRK